MSIISRSLASIPSASAGKQSVTRLIQRMCTGSRMVKPNSVAKKMLNDESLEPAFRHFALHIIADAACDHDGSKAELESALAAESDETDPFIKIQLRHNRAIAHIENGQFKVVDDEFKKIYRDAKRWDIRNKSFLLMLFENAVLNKTRVGLPDGGVEEGRRLIGECERALAPLGPYDYGQLFIFESFS